MTLRATGAMEELLLQLRSLMDNELHTLKENTSLRDVLSLFRSTVQDLPRQEPSFWQLQVVLCIQNVLKLHVRDCVHNAVACTSKEQSDPTQIVTRVKNQIQKSKELNEALLHLQENIETEIVRLKEVLNEGDKGACDEHFLTQFWEKLQTAVDRREMQLEINEDEAIDDVESVLESCSFERLTFDDDCNDLPMSTINPNRRFSFPCMEEFSTIIERMQDADLIERAAGLDELMQISIVEIIQSGTMFPATCSAIVGLFLDSDPPGARRATAERAKKVIYDLVDQIDDAMQFLALYWVLLDFIGSHLETGKLFLDRHDIDTSNCAHSIAVLDCFRVLLLLKYRILRHWVYFTPEALAQVFHSTFRLLTMYSRTESEVQAQHLNPLLILSLIDDRPMQWFKLWLLNAPNPRQLFLALDESGLIADILQTLSREEPLTSMESWNVSTDAVAKRLLQCRLIILSYTCDYKEGRELIKTWKRRSAHAYIKQRRSHWHKVALETIAAENDALYGTVETTASDEDHEDESKGEYEHLGTGAIDALVLSIVSMIVTRPTCLRGENNVTYDGYWTQSILDSVTTYLHTTHNDSIYAELGKIVAVCWACESSELPSSQNFEETKSWVPFRRSKSVTEVCQLVVGNISTKIKHGVLSKEDVHASGQLILRMIISSKIMAQVSSFDTMVAVFDLCKRFIHSWTTETIAQSEKMPYKGHQSELVVLITNMSAIPEASKAANASGIVNELLTSCSVLLTRDEDHQLLELSRHIVATLCHSAVRVHYAHYGQLVSAYLQAEYKYSHELEAIALRTLLDCLSLPLPARLFFSLNDVQGTAARVIASLQENADSAMTLNSPDDEWPSHLATSMRSLHLLRCCMSTQFAAKSLLSVASCPLIQFIATTLADHKQGVCMRSCHAEDTCCVAFQLALSLVSSVPAMLECSSLFSKLELLTFHDKTTLERYAQHGDTEPLGACSFLEKQLRYELEFVGGPCERLPQCELFAFDAHLWHKSSIPTDSIREERRLDGPSRFTTTLANTIIQAIEDSGGLNSSTPLDVVLISQTSWELITELETESAFATSTSRAAFTDTFANLMYHLVLSKCSRLESTVDSNVENFSTIANTAACGLNDDAVYSTDTERKLMKRLYETYAHYLALPVASSLFDCIVQTFGKAAMDCYPVTILMILSPTYKKVDVLRFLSHCLTSPWHGFLWPRSIRASRDGGERHFPATVIAKGVEFIIGRECPRLLRVMNQCQSSVSSLVLRWHSQHFWNYFDWHNIVIFTYLSILYGADFQIYVLVAVMNHLEPTMRDLTAKHSAQSFAPCLTLLREPIRGFRFSSWQSFLLRLQSTYHDEMTTLLFPLVEAPGSAP